MKLVMKVNEKLSHHEGHEGHGEFGIVFFLATDPHRWTQTYRKIVPHVAELFTVRPLAG